MAMALIVHKRDLKRMEGAKFTCSLPDKVKVKMKLRKKLVAESKAEEKKVDVEVDSSGEASKKIVGGPVTYFDAEEWCGPGEKLIPRTRRPRWPYLHGWKFCRLCDQYMLTDEDRCPIHHLPLRTNPRSGSREAVRYSVVDRVSIGEEKVDDDGIKVLVNKVAYDGISQDPPYRCEKSIRHVKNEKRFLMDIGVW